MSILKTLVPMILANVAAGCSGNSSAVPTAAQSPSSIAGSIDCTGCWPTYAHDYQRTGFQNQKTGIDAGDVARLTPKWAHVLNEQVVVSPVLEAGKVFIGTAAGNLYAFNDSNGTVVWRRNLGGLILETPTIDHGNLYVGTHVEYTGANTPPSTFFALDISSGAVVWQASVPGDFRGSAAVSNGVVYVGESGGDPPQCDQGGLHAYSAATGAELFFWRTDPNPQDGGAVWSPITIDGPNIVFGTGNTCSNGVANANSLIRLTATGTQEWEVPINDLSSFDDDWGGGVMLAGGNYYVANKNGYFYGINPVAGTTSWKNVLSAFDGQGSIATPTTDGTVVIEPSGNLLDGHVANPPTANVSAYSLAGRKLWTSFTFDNIQRSYVPIADGLAYVAADDRIVAVDAHSGTPLWAYTSSGSFVFASAPAITPDGLFTVDSGGAIIAFVAAASTAAVAEVKINLRRGPLNEPYGSIIQLGANGSYKVRY